MAIYVVTEAEAPEGAKPRMVKSRTKQQAISHVVGDRFKAEPLDTERAISLAAEGVVLEDIAATEDE